MIDAEVEKLARGTRPEPPLQPGEMTAARNVMRQALDRYKAAPEKDAAKRADALQAFEGAKERFEALKKRFDEAGKPPAAP